MLHFTEFHVDQPSGANFKKSVQISCFFQEKTCKNAENDYFDQRLECAATKRWSKYTTYIGSTIVAATSANHYTMPLPLDIKTARSI